MHKLWFRITVLYSQLIICHGQEFRWYQESAPEIMIPDPKQKPKGYANYRQPGRHSFSLRPHTVYSITKNVV